MRLLSNGRYLLKYKERFRIGRLPHYDIALACTSYLLSGLTLADSRCEEDRKLIDVAKGLHGLQLYANEFWLEHVLAYASLAHDEAETLPASELLSALTVFGRKQKSIWSETNELVESKSTLQKSPAPDPRVEFFQKHEDIYFTISSLSTFRRIPKAILSSKNSGTISP